MPSIGRRSGNLRVDNSLEPLRDDHFIDRKNMVLYLAVSVCLRYKISLETYGCIGHKVRDGDHIPRMGIDKRFVPRIRGLVLYLHHMGEDNRTTGRDVVLQASRLFVAFTFERILCYGDGLF